MAVKEITPSPVLKTVTQGGRIFQYDERDIRIQTVRENLDRGVTDFVKERYIDTPAGKIVISREDAWR